MKYTHSALIAAGYVRQEHPGYPGWVTYEKGGTWSGVRVGFAGNDATMNNWIENVSRWKTNFPEVYAWWIDPSKKDPLIVGNETIIKGEDPKLIEEAQDGQTSPEPVSH